MPQNRQSLYQLKQFFEEQLLHTSIQDLKWQEKTTSQ